MLLFAIKIRALRPYLCPRLTPRAQLMGAIKVSSFEWRCRHLVSPTTI